jgi:hypothetical protein
MSSIRQPLFRLTTYLGRLLRHDLTLIILVMTIARLLAIVALRPGGYAAETGPDSPYHFQFGRWAAAGAYPFLDYWVEYPPLFPWLTVLAYKIATFMPAWIDQRFWFNLVLHSLVVPFDSANAILIYWLSRRLHAPAEALKSAWLYALLFTPLFVTLGWFENLALFGVLLFLWAILANRFLLAGLALAFAALVKPYAAVAGAVAAIRLLPPPWRPFFVFSGAFLLVLLLGFAPFWLASPDMTQAHFDNLLSRPAWSTPYALVDGLIKHTEFRLTDRFDPGLAAVPITPSRLPHSLVTLAFALVYGVVWWRAGRYQHDRAILALASLTFSLYMLWSKGYSPQWSLYLLALLCILMPNLRGVLLMLVLDALYILEWPVTFILLKANAGYLTGVVTLRTLFLIGLAFLFGGLIFARQEQDWRRIRLASMAGSLAAVLAVVALAISALPLYAAQRYQTETMRKAVELIRSTSTPEQAGILFDRADTYERLAPYLNGWPKLAALRMGSAADSWSDQEISRFAGQRPELWYVIDFGATGYRETAEAINRTLGDSFCPVNRQFAGDALVSHYVTVAPSIDLGVSAAFADGIMLENASISETPPAAEGGGFCVQLVWSVIQPPPADYTVFVHLLDANGQLVAQSDLTPGNGYAPTTNWPAGETVLDRHGLILPPAIAPGRYEVMVGLYEATTGARLPLLSANGDALRLTQVEIQP